MKTLRILPQIYGPKGEGVITRRSVLLGLAGISAGVFRSLASADSQIGGGEHGAKQWYRKLLYSAVSGPVIWSILGTKYARVENALTPLWSTNTVDFSRITHRPDGEYRLDRLEVVFYTDLTTGERLDTWTNPYSQKKLAVTLPEPHPITSFSEKNKVKPDGNAAGLSVVEVSSPPSRHAGEVRIRAEKRVTLQPPGTESPVFQGLEMLTYSGRYADLSGDLDSVSATVAVEIFSDWLPWMQMAQRPGGLYTKADGVKLHDLESLPTSTRLLLEKHFPQIAADPYAYLDSALSHDGSAGSS